MHFGEMSFSFCNETCETANLQEQQQVARCFSHMSLYVGGGKRKFGNIFEKKIMKF